MEIGPLGIGYVGRGAGGVVEHDPAGKCGVDKGAEFINSMWQGGGNFVATVLETENPMAVIVLIENSFQFVGTEEGFVEGAAKGVVVDNTVGSAMEEAGWRRGYGIFELPSGAVDSAGVGDDGRWLEGGGECGGGGQTVAAAIVGLQHGYGACTTAGKDDVRGVYTQFGSVGTEPCYGLGAVFDGITDGRVEKGVHFEQRHPWGMFQVETVVDGDGHEPPVGKRTAAFLRVLVVAFTHGESTTEHVYHAGVVGTWRGRLIDIEFELHGVALAENESPLGSGCKECRERKYH